MTCAIIELQQGKLSCEIPSLEKMLPFTLYDLNEKYLLDTTNVEIDLSISGSSSRSLNVIATNPTVEVANGPFSDKHLALRVIVAITCCLSMLGSLLIILSYFMIKEIQTKSRQILMHLSLADFGVACCNFIGVSIYFDQYIRWCPMEKEDHETGVMAVFNHLRGSLRHNSAVSCKALEALCEAQAFVAAFSTLASVLWTLSLALYIYCLVVHSKSKAHLRVVWVAYVLCWGLPLFISIWLISTGRLGYSPHGNSGWCTLKVDYTDGGIKDTFAIVFGNDLWIYLTFIMVSILYLTTHFYIKFQLKETRPSLLQGSNLATVSKADTKFILIPFFFLLLRMWTVILVILMVYARVHPPHLLSLILLYAAGIGDSGQGFVNAFLFCVFTPRVRQHFLFLLKKVCCCARHKWWPFNSRRNSRFNPTLHQSLSSTFPVLRGRVSISNYAAGNPSKTDSSEDGKQTKKANVVVSTVIKQ